MTTTNETMTTTEPRNAKNIVNQIIQRISWTDETNIAECIPQLFGTMIGMVERFVNGYKSDLYHDAIHLTKDITPELVKAGCDEHGHYSIVWACRDYGTEYLNLSDGSDRRWFNMCREKHVNSSHEDWWQFTITFFPCPYARRQFTDESINRTYTCEVTSNNTSFPDMPDLKTERM